jgi:hypothetical protein
MPLASFRRFRSIPGHAPPPWITAIRLLDDAVQTEVQGAECELAQARSVGAIGSSSPEPQELYLAILCTRSMSVSLQYTPLESTTTMLT